MVDQPDEPLPLPGLDDVAEIERRRKVQDVELGVRRTLMALYAEGKFSEQHAGLLALVIATAREVDRKQGMPKSSSMFSNDARLLFERLDLLLGAADAQGVDELLRQKMAEWEAEFADVPDGQMPADPP